MNWRGQIWVVGPDLISIHPATRSQPIAWRVDLASKSLQIFSSASTQVRLDTVELLSTNFDGVLSYVCLCSPSQFLRREMVVGRVSGEIPTAAAAAAAVNRTAEKLWSDSSALSPESFSSCGVEAGWALRGRSPLGRCQTYRASLRFDWRRRGESGKGGPSLEARVEVEIIGIQVLFIAKKQLSSRTDI